MASGWCGARIGIAAWASATPCGAALFVAWLFVATMGAAIAPTSGARAQEDASPAASEPGATDAWFVYETTRTVGQGTGAYAGYSDGLRAAGRYDLRAEGGTLSIAASYAWTYQGETCDDGRVDRVVTADFTTRLYTGNTDLDDYDGRVGATPLATWTWIPPTTAPGESVRVLERDFVAGEPESIEIAGRSVPAIVLRAEGSDRRDDAYGTFETTFEDSYWFDAATGYFLQSRYVERDEGSSAGAPATFVWRETVTVTGASYLEGTSDVVTPVDACAAPAWAGEDRSPSQDNLGTLIWVFGGAFVLVVFAFLRFRPVRRPITIDGHDVKIAPLRSVDDFVPVEAADSPHLAPFHRHLVEQALRAGEPVFEASLANGRVVGLGIGDREGRTGSIFAREADACELLRRALDVTELFTETRHEHLPSVGSAALAAGRTETPKAYNVYETYVVLALSAPSAVPYDAKLVRRMTEQDLADVAALSQKVHGVRGERWLAAALGTGELGFVARRGGELVGYAFATVVGAEGRLHGNTVHPDHRGQGIGKELTRARLTACAALGASRIVTEIATHNVASLEVARSLGFQSVGQMWVESAAAVRVERPLLRR
jgi:L-amino acid N-acyltransferase YncA